MKPLAALLFVLTITACAESDGPPPPEDLVACDDGKCDGSTSPYQCALEAPPPLPNGARPGPEQYELADVPPDIAQLFTQWLAYAAPRDEYVKTYKLFDNRFRMKVEKVIANAPGRVIFQATTVVDRPDSTYEGFPTLQSFVVFWDGSTFRWIKGRSEFEVGDSLLVNVNASGAYMYNWRPDYATRYVWTLLDGRGVELKSVTGIKGARFRRLDAELVLGMTADGTIVVRPTGITSVTTEPVPCNGYRRDPWGRF